MNGGADGEQTPPSAGGWPPPHPSPPLPAPREYGVPGAAPSRAPYVVGAVAVLVVVAVVVLLVVLLGGGDDAEEEPVRATDEPTPTQTSETSETAAAPAYTCWDGATAAALEECSAPTGEAGLAWVFPVIEQARCGPAAAAGGATTRVLCRYRLADGTRAQLGFFEWPSVEAGRASYDGRGLTVTEGTDVVIRWSGDGKAVTMYATAPYSITVAYPPDAAPSGDDVAALEPRPADELTGVTAQ